MPRIECSTTFDITETRVTGHCRPERFPFADRAGQTVSDDRTWNHSRNQQRNFETLIQLVSLRTQIDSVSHPNRQGNRWYFEFTVEHLNVYSDDLSVLQSDSDGVPMMIGLNSRNKLKPFLIPGQNVWFKVVEEK